MELDARKIIILKTIIKNYLETGEPVGSRTISKYSELNLSSATIRNEMSDLEEMGYIIQPHTSAGRIPSDKGYRFYVDSIMKESDDRVNEVTELMVKKVDKLEMEAGLVEVVGPGVMVSLQDSSAANVTGDEADYLIHDNDLLSVINELRSAGAEAISLNGERILATSEVRCTGAVVTVNGRRYAAPYIIFAIGDPDTLYSALTMRSGVADILSQWGISVRVTASDLLLIPKYNGSIDYQYARGVAPGGEGGE